MMSLDRFYTGSSQNKKKSPSASHVDKKKTTSPEKGEKVKRKKYYLSCTKSCGFKRVIRKANLSQKDYICPKCGKKMKVTKIE